MKRFVLVVLVLAALAWLFSVVVVVKPDWFPSLTRARETIAALSTGGVVLATLVLAYATLRIIENDRNLRASSRLEAYAKDICDWAVDVVALCAPTDVGITVAISSTPQVVEAAMAARQMESIIVLVARGEYVEMLAGAHFPAAICEKAGEILSLLRQHHEIQRLRTQAEVSAKSANTHKERLNESAKALVAAVVAYMSHPRVDVRLRSR